MGDLLWLIVVIVMLFLFVGVLSILVKKLERAKAASQSPAAAGNGEAESGPETPYQVRESVLSPGERAFLPALHEAVRILAESRRLPPPTVFASIRFAEILAVGISQSENRSRWQTAQNRITSKQADFVICHPETTKPLLVVELDDVTHARADRKERDEFVDRACASAGLPLLHVRAAAKYNPQDLAREIGNLLTPGVN